MNVISLEISNSQLMKVYFLFLFFSRDRQWKFIVCRMTDYDCQFQSV